MTDRRSLVDTRDEDAADEPRTTPFAALPFLLTGGALVAHVLLDLPMVIAFLLGAVGIGLLLVGIVARSEDVRGLPGRAVVEVGLVASVLALIGYDGSRLLVSELAGWTVGPFEALPHFGTALLGEGASLGARQVAGVSFHVANALGFGLAYTIVAGRRGVVAGVLWGLALEVVMLGLYPAWLQIEQLNEFVTMSVIGHVVYGATLGVVAQRGLAGRAPVEVA